MFRKRGSISLSFGMIFSIIIIIAIIGVAFYAINYFLNLGVCTDISLFHQNFQEEVDEAWNSEISRGTFTATLPRGIDSVCFKHEGSSGVGDEYESSSDYFRAGGNVFLYPPERACGQVSRSVKHVDLSELGWHCFQKENGKVNIALEKGSFDALVKVKRG